MIDYPTEAQSNNVLVINCLWAFKQGLEDITATSQNVDEVSMAEVDRLCHAVLDPLVESATDSIEAILLTMHSQEDLGLEIVKEEVTKVSPYMKELRMFVRRVTADFISPFNFKKIVGQKAASIVKSTVETFVIQASLVSL